MGVRGIIVLVKLVKVGQKYRDKATLALALATLVAIVLVFKAGAYRY